MRTNTVRLSDDEYEAWVAVAQQTERSQNDILREALRNHPDIETYLKTKKARQAQNNA